MAILSDTEVPENFCLLFLDQVCTYMCVNEDFRLQKKPSNLWRSCSTNTHIKKHRRCIVVNNYLRFVEFVWYISLVYKGMVSDFNNGIAWLYSTVKRKLSFQPAICCLSFRFKWTYIMCILYAWITNLTLFLQCNMYVHTWLVYA